MHSNSPAIQLSNLLNREAYKEKYSFDEVTVTKDTMKSIKKITVYDERFGHKVRSCEEQSNDLAAHNIYSNFSSCHSLLIAGEARSACTQSTDAKMGSCG